MPHLQSYTGINTASSLSGLRGGVGQVFEGKLNHLPPLFPNTLFQIKGGGVPKIDVGAIETIIAVVFSFVFWTSILAHFHEICSPK